MKQKITLRYVLVIAAFIELIILCILTIDSEASQRITTIRNTIIIRAPFLYHIVGTLISFIKFSLPIYCGYLWKCAHDKNTFEISAKLARINVILYIIFLAYNLIEWK